jgi:hypothetical protein
MIIGVSGLKEAKGQRYRIASTSYFSIDNKMATFGLLEKRDVYIACPDGYPRLYAACIQCPTFRP